MRRMTFACCLLFACTQPPPRAPTTAPPHLPAHTPLPPASAPVIPVPYAGSAEELNQKISYYLSQGVEAYQSKDFARLVESYREVLALSPHNPSLKYVLARAYALDEQPEEALSLLGQLADLGLSYRLSHPDLASLQEEPALADLGARMEKNRAPLHASEPAFLFPEEDLLLEGIDYDPQIRSFWVSSVRQRTVLRIDQKGAVTRALPEGSPTLYGAFGIAIDAKNRALWVCSAATPEVKDLRPEEEGRTALLRYHLDTGALEKEYLLSEGGRHAFGDITLSSRGDAFLSDGLSGELYAVPHDTKELSLLLPAGYLRSPQGLALSEDEDTLFVVDYTGGLFALDLRTRVLRKLSTPPSLPLYGMDGLRRYGRSLIAVQNGVPPTRLVRLFLDKEARSVTQSEILERGTLEEPTQGVIVGDTLYYIAVSQWTNFSGGALPEPEALTKAQIWKLALR